MGEVESEGVVGADRWNAANGAVGVEDAPA